MQRCQQRLGAPNQTLQALLLAEEKEKQAYAAAAAAM
ncbi:hypothetical protein X741_28695 [Mesorhizobium sp. LNHC229A00]|nr:hypothetical protein X741_28695 [Mesorhizobium sp. LNHC229A00]